jgi:hypothetical protein
VRLEINPEPSAEERVALLKAISALIREERARAGPGAWFAAGRVLGLRSPLRRLPSTFRAADRWPRSYRMDPSTGLIPRRLGRGDAR